VLTVDLVKKREQALQRKRKTSRLFVRQCLGPEIAGPPAFTDATSRNWAEKDQKGTSVLKRTHVKRLFTPEKIKEKGKTQRGRRKERRSEYKGGGGQKNLLTQRGFLFFSRFRKQTVVTEWGGNELERGERVPGVDREKGKTGPASIAKRSAGQVTQPFFPARPR